MRSEKFKLTLKLHKVSVQIENTINIICFELKPCMGTVVPVFTKSLQTFKALKKKGICNGKKNVDFSMSSVHYLVRLCLFVLLPRTSPASFP